MSRPSKAALRAAHEIQEKVATFYRGRNSSYDDYQVATIIDAAADQKYKPLVGAAGLKRNTAIHDNPDFVGEWTAIPTEDFDALREALQRAKGE